MNSFRLRGAFRVIVALALSTLGTPAGAMSIDVPGDQPTLQAAVGAAAVSPDVDNEITISASPITTGVAVSLGPAFSAARRLVIRPADNLDRATVVNTNPSVAIFDLSSAGYVTLQDLDILRNITNDHHLVQMTVCESIVIQRCRIGSNWVSGGTPGWANVFMIYPTDIVLRNNILFAETPGTFDRGIDAGSFNDPDNSLHLYDNDVADFKQYGIRVEAVVPGALVLLRNNVVANSPSVLPEPVAYRTEVGVGPTVVSSHNVAFATGALVQSGAGQSIAGLGSQFLVFAKGDAANAFVTTDWDRTTFDANPDFYRLEALGPLHDDAGDYGMTVTNVAPDIVVPDDIEQDYRPGGLPLHFDRGADQIEPGVDPAAVGPRPGSSGLRAVILTNPAPSVRVAWTSRWAGRLVFEIFDTTGRRLHSEARVVGTESSGAFEWRDPEHTGIAFYRLRVDGAGHGGDQVVGRVVVLR